jgi:hypothetical protein
VNGFFSVSGVYFLVNFSGYPEKEKNSFLTAAVAVFELQRF